MKRVWKCRRGRVDSLQNDGKGRSAKAKRPLTQPRYSLRRGERGSDVDPEIAIGQSRVLNRMDGAALSRAKSVVSFRCEGEADKGLDLSGVERVISWS